MTTGIGGGMDPGALQRKALEEAAKQADHETAKPAASLPEENDAQRFLEAMHSPDPSGATPEAAPGISDAASPSQAAGLGDRIIRGMQSASETVQAGRAEAAEVLGRENVTQADLLRANFAMMESSNLVSAVSKTTEKITQSIKTLQQG